MVLVVTEKKSVADAIAEALGATLSPEKSYYVGPLYTITWLYGHVVEMVSEYDDKPWSIDELPLLPERFCLRVGRETDQQGRKLKTENRAYRTQLDTLKRLSERCDFIVNAGDCGREGEVIQREAYFFIGYKGLVKRLWISSLAEEAVRAGFNKLHDSREYDNLYRAGKCRAEADWLVGVNATRALSLHSEAPSPLSAGRVQTTVLCMIVRRYLANKSFVPQPYWTLRGEMNLKGYTEKWFGLDRFMSPEEAENAFSEVTASGLFRVEGFKHFQDSVEPKLLHNITSLQKIANTRLGLTADETLRITQELYEKRLVSYPRTPSRYITEEDFKTVPDILKRLLEQDRYKDFVQQLANDADGLNRRCVDDSKVLDSHIGLIPTGKIPKELKENEEKVYGLILSRFLEAFMKPCIVNKATIDFSACDGKYSFQMTGSKVMYPGWKAVSGVEADDEDKAPDDNEAPGEGEDNVYPLPNVNDGELYMLGQAELRRKMTRPQPLFTDATLLSEMEKAGKDIDDKELKRAIRDVGIGTPATRASEINILVQRGYVSRNSRKQFIPSQLGINLYRAIKDSRLADVSMTAEWEMTFQRINDGVGDPEVFRERIRNYAKLLTGDIINGPKVEFTTYTCPKCGKTMYDRGKCVRCRDCGQTYWKTYSGKTLTPSQLGDLIEKGETAELKGFRKKDGDREFAAVLFLDENKEVRFRFIDHSKDKDGEQLVCPLCGQPVKVFEGSVSCSSESCQWHMSRKVGGKLLSDKHISALLKGESTGVIKGLTNREHTKTFDAKLVLDQGKLKYVFETPFDSLVCPHCGGTGIRVFEKFFACPDREGCGWSASRIIAGRLLTDSQIIKLMSTGRTEPLEFTKKSDGTPFKARVILKNTDDGVSPVTAFEFVNEKRKD